MKITKEMVKREVKEWAWAIGVALILTLILRTYVIQAFKIPSGSMIPTLKVGDKLFVNKYVYRFEEPQRGDIIVFKFPSDPKKDFIKRLVAKPGDTIEIREGHLVVNGETQEASTPFAQFYYYNHGPYGDPGQKIIVPPDSYYVLGDNSANSTDSRFWGFVPKKNLLGKAIFRWWPANRIGKIQ